MTVTGQGGTPQDISGAVTCVITRFVRARVGDYGLAQALAQAGELRPVQVLEDPRSWSTHDEAIRLLAAASQVTGDADIGRHIGEEMLRQHDGTDVANLLRSLGSPGELLRNVTAAAAKFTTVSSLEPLEVGDAHAVVRAVTRPGFIRHIYLCEFTKGLLSQVPVLFGLVPAVVTETECQARGGRFCLYSVAWEAGQWTSFVDDRSSLFSAAWEEQSVVEAPAALNVDADSRIGMLEEQLRQMSRRLEEVFSTASDLLEVDDISELLARITRRAAHAVNAPRYLIVVRTQPGTRAELHQHGFAEEEARALAEDLWQPEPDDAGGSRLIVDVASSRQRYGRLAAVYPPGMRFMEREREIFSLYANYAATALDVVTALSDSRRATDTARALLEFSRSLSHIGTTDEVAQTLADTVPHVIGCERASVMLWDPFDQKLSFKAVSGFEMARPEPELPVPDGEPIRFVAEDEIDLPDEPGEQLPFTTFGMDEMPSLARLLTSREILVVDRQTADPYQLAVLEQYGTELAMIAPLFSDEEFLGIVTADFLEAPATDPRNDRDLHERLTALADQAVTSFQNAWLLEQVGHQAWHDALTGLPNRRLLEDRVVQELERAKRVNETSTMFFVDLDRFKRVNDTLGHGVGDELLKVVSQRLRDSVRRQDTVARLGGDEFAILLPGLSDIDDIRNLAQQMIDILHEPYALQGAEVLTSASIGVAISPGDGDTYDDLLSHADEAMYRAKELGRNNYQLYSTAPAADAGSDLELQAELEEALRSGQLFLAYQPYVKLATNRVVGVEALVRWRHPQRGVLGPGSFLPEAEASGLIVQVDQFVIAEAFRQMRQWLDDGLPPLRMSVNVSGQDLLAPDFVTNVIDALRDNSIPAELCELELTERVQVDDGGVMRESVERLHQLGVRFSIDDFGTGTLSMQQVAAFPVVALKVDPSLLRGAGGGDDLGPLASAAIGMAEKLGVECVAKGVETDQQVRVLVNRGATVGQGAYFSPPVPPGDVLRIVLEWPKGARGNALAGAAGVAAPPAAQDDQADPDPGDNPAELEIHELREALDQEIGELRQLVSQAMSQAMSEPEPELELEPEPEIVSEIEPDSESEIEIEIEEAVADSGPGPLEAGEPFAIADDGIDPEAVDPFEISPDVLSELGLDISPEPDPPAEAAGDPPFEDLGLEETGDHDASPEASAPPAGEPPPRDEAPPSPEMMTETAGSDVDVTGGAAHEEEPPAQTFAGTAGAAGWQPSRRNRPMPPAGPAF